MMSKQAALCDRILRHTSDSKAQVHRHHKTLVQFCLPSDMAML